MKTWYLSKTIVAFAIASIVVQLSVTTPVRERFGEDVNSVKIPEVNSYVDQDQGSKPGSLDSDGMETVRQLASKVGPGVSKGDMARSTLMKWLENLSKATLLFQIRYPGLLPENRVKVVSCLNHCQVLSDGVPCRPPYGSHKDIKDGGLKQFCVCKKMAKTGTNGFHCILEPQIPEGLGMNDLKMTWNF